MFVLGIQGSPRKNGNSDDFLTLFLKVCEAHGAETEVVRPQDRDIRPCRELVVCERQGVCPIRDEMEAFGYEKVKQADVVVLASPVFFYGITAQAKTFIDRCQMFWSRKYRLGLRDPQGFSRKGFLLSVAASAGKRVFDGVELTARYFFDAISADYAGSLTYKRVENAGDIAARPGLTEDVRKAVEGLMDAMRAGRDILFVSGRGSCRSIMAAAFANAFSEGRVRATAAGAKGPGIPGPGVIRAMAASRLDVKYLRSSSLEDRTACGTIPDPVIFLGSKAEYEAAVLPAGTLLWELPDPVGDDLKSLTTIRDTISGRVRTLVNGL